MHTLFAETPRTPILQSAAPSLRGFVTTARQGSPTLMRVAAGSVVLLGATLLLGFVDPRELGGTTVWAKPAKFAASVVLTAPLLAFIMAKMPTTRGLRRASALMSAGFVIELVFITMQAARGVPSHFNFTTPFNAVVFQIMATTITGFWLVQMWLTYRTFRSRFADKAMGWGLRIGLLLSTIGAGLAFVMPSRPSPAQLEAIAAQQPTTIGAHAVGVEDGGAGLPLTRWSTEGGDLRVAHFVGLHSLQVVPFAAWLISRRRRRPHAPAKPSDERAVLAFGVIWAGLMVTTFVQALRAQPLLAPDLGTIGLAFGFGLVAAAIMLRRSRPVEVRVRLTHA